MKIRNKEYEVLYRLRWIKVMKSKVYYKNIVEYLLLET
jgi:hypothetical protein